jgi:hypothetical protein
VKSLNATRLFGMALAAVGIIVLLIARLLGYPLVLYVGIIVIVAGFIIYTAAVLKVPTTSKDKTEIS